MRLLLFLIFIATIFSCAEKPKLKHQGFDVLVLGSETIYLYENETFEIELGLGYHKGKYFMKDDSIFLNYDESVDLPKIFILKDSIFKSVDEPIISIRQY